MKKTKKMLMCITLIISLTSVTSCGSSYEEKNFYDWEEDWDDEDNWSNEESNEKETTPAVTTKPETMTAQATTVKGLKSDIENAMKEKASNEEIENIIKEYNDKGVTEIGTVSFEVCDYDTKEVLDNVSVLYKNTTIGFEASSVVNEKTVKNLPYGKYEFTISKDGYRTETYTLTELICNDTVYEAKLFMKREK